MDIDRFQQQHAQILSLISRMREQAHRGIEENAREIASHVRVLKSVVVAHLQVEDTLLYPRMQRLTGSTVARLAQQFQTEMKPLASQFVDFVERWSSEEAVRAKPDGFRQEANLVLRALHQRIQREEADFYPQAAAI